MPKIKLFALTTCVWCKKTIDLLEKNKIQFELIYIDKLKGKEREKALNAIRRYNPRISFPTLVVEDEIIVGFDEERIKKVLKIMDRN